MTFLHDIFFFRRPSTGCISLFVAPLLDLASKHARTVSHSITVLVLSAFSYFCLLSPLLFFAVQYMRRKNIKLLCRMSDTAPHLRTTGINSPPCHSDNVAKPIGTLTESSMAVKRVALLFFAFAAALASVQGQCELICCLYRSCVLRKGKNLYGPHCLAGADWFSSPCG